MYFVGTVTITIKCNNEFTGLFHTYRFWTEKKIVLIKRNFLNLSKLHKELKCALNSHKPMTRL